MTSSNSDVLVAGFSQRYLEFHDGDWYRILDNQSSEAEMGQFLFGLVRYLKPFIAIETGCCVGHTTKCISDALSENVKGKLISCDTNPERVAKAKEHCGIGPHEIRHCSSLDLPELNQADFIFSDSDFDSRLVEFERAKPGCTYVVHDIGMIPELALLVKNNGGMIFAKGRGFGIIQKG